MQKAGISGSGTCGGAGRGRGAGGRSRAGDSSAGWAAPPRAPRERAGPSVWNPAASQPSGQCPLGAPKKRPTDRMQVARPGGTQVAPRSRTCKRQERLASQAGPAPESGRRRSTAR